MRPGTVEEAAALLREHEGAVAPRGGGTRPWGPPSAGQVLETGGLAAIVEHNAGDFTAVLEAGVPLAEAQAAFAEHGQMLALDPPEDPRATIGGALATNDTGPLRHRYGGLRDLVVGTTVVLSDGTVAASGGRVIKNVAGYDLGKLFCGSYGTLGLIARVALRLHPLVPETATAAAGTDDPDRLGAAAATLAARPLEADCLDVAWREGAGRLLVRFAGAAAGEQARAAATLLGELGLERAAVEADDGALWAAQRAGQRGDCVLKVSGRVTDLPAVCRTGAEVVGRAGLGLYWLRVAPAEIEAVRARLVPRACTLLDAPEDLRHAAWPEVAPGTLAVMERLKQRFDPARAFRPGAFVGGL